MVFQLNFSLVEKLSSIASIKIGANSCTLKAIPQALDHFTHSLDTKRCIYHQSLVSQSFLVINYDITSAGTVKRFFFHLFFAAHNTFCNKDTQCQIYNFQITVKYSSTK